MALLQRFDPPAFLTDYDGIPGQREAWHNFVSRCFAASIAGEADKVLRADGSRGGAVQFYNPAVADPGGPVVAQAILWNAFPKELLRRWGRERAMIEADRLYPLGHYRDGAGQGSAGFEAALYRPQDEYCEWHVVRDPDTNKIVRVTFSSEPPEYWEAMFGTPIDPGDGTPLAFPGDRDRVLALYRALVGPQVAMNDLICAAEIRGPDGSVYVQQGQYNPYNKWNTTHGIVHLCAPPNALTAEIQLGADATVLYRNATGEPVVEPSALICCAGFGGPDRNSDPTIGATVNALARAGAMVTLPNPVGLYMDHIDLAGWQAPEGVRVADCVRVERGTPGMIERLVIEVPSGGGDRRRPDDRRRADHLWRADCRMHHRQADRRRRAARRRPQCADAMRRPLLHRSRRPARSRPADRAVARRTARHAGRARRRRRRQRRPAQHRSIRADRGTGAACATPHQGRRVMSEAGAAPFQAPQEPILDMAEIQGIALPGFFKPHHTLLYLRLADGQSAVERFKVLIARLSGEVATAAQTLADRRRHRQAILVPAAAREGMGAVLIALAFSYTGLKRLTPGADDIPDLAFRKGLVARSALLGDPTDPASEGHPSRWVVGGAGAELDALAIIAGDERPAVTARAEALAAELRQAGLDVETQDGDVRDDLPGHEHFGFDDGVSQPGPRGLASTQPDDYLTDRYLDPRGTPAAWLYGYPGQDLVWPGEFVLGYPATSPDPLVPGLAALAQPAWTRNGSFLVYRRLRQDVGLFWRTMREEAARLAALPGFSGLTDAVLAARLVGRWPSGAPVNRVPRGDDPKLGDDALANNDFRFDSDTPAPILRGRQAEPYPLAKADPAGVACPWAAHIRKVNTRDSANDMGAREATYGRRLLRVGVAFGKPLADRYAEPAADPEHGNRGLLFLAIQASIEGQFEFLQARWANDATRPKMPGGNDMVIGQNAATSDGIRRCTLFGSDLGQGEVRAAGQWVIPTGGGYFFVPSVSALRDVIAR